MKYLLFLLIGFLTVNTSCASPETANAAPPSHKIWDNLLHKYVNDHGLVNYKGLKNESKELDQYLNLLSSHPPEKSWSNADQKAYWINAYNAFTVKLILTHYPVKSIKDIGPAIQITHVNTPWQIKFFKIGNDKMDLDEIEAKLRKDFNDPRVHFAIVCASISCPPLRNEAYEGSKIDKQLDDQAKTFLADNSKNKISADKLNISKIFNWYKGDFTKNGSIISFLNKYAPVKINANADISYMDYNWGLNEQ